MKSICNERNVIQIVSNDRYIAVIGCGITILERATFAFVHRFAGIRHIHGGIFLDDDVLAVFTGEQRLYFFQISEKKLLWECPRPSQLAPTGDMRCCSIPSVNQIVCIAEGNQGLEDHILLLVDYQKRTYTLQNITSCRRVASSLVWNQELGVTLLSYEKLRDTVTWHIVLQGSPIQAQFLYYTNGNAVNAKTHILASTFS